MDDHFPVSTEVSLRQSLGFDGVWLLEIVPKEILQIVFNDDGDASYTESQLFRIRDHCVELIDKLLVDVNRSDPIDASTSLEALFYGFAAMLKMIAFIGNKLEGAAELGDVMVSIISKAKQLWLQYGEHEKVHSYCRVCMNVLLNTLSIGVNPKFNAISPCSFENNVFFLHLFDAEALLKSSKVYEATKVLNFLGPRADNPSNKLAVACLCFNAGLCLFKQRDHVTASKMFKLSFNIGKDVMDLSCIEKLLYCLSFSYFKQNDSRKWAKALLALQIRFKGENEKLQAISAVNAVLFPSNVGNHTHDITLFDLPNMCWVKELVEIFTCLPTDAFYDIMLTIGKNLSDDAKMYLLHSNLKEHFLDDNIKQVYAVVDKMIEVSCYPGSDSKKIISVILLLIDYAKQKFQASKYEESLQLYYYASSLIQIRLSSENNFENLLRHISILMSYCCMKLAYIEKANSIIMSIESFEEITANELTYLLEIALVADNENLTVDVVSAIVTEMPRNEIFHLILSSCNVAMNSNRTNGVLVAKVLSKLLDNVEEDISLLCRILKCLTLILIKNSAPGSKDKVPVLVNSLYGTFAKMRNFDLSHNSKMLTDTCKWISKVVWEYIKCTELTADLKFELSSYCCDFLMIRLPYLTAEDFIQLKSILLNLFSSGIKAVHRSENTDINDKYLRKLMSTWEIIVKSAGGSTAKSIFGADRKSMEIYLLYFFEVNLMLNNQVNVGFLANLVNSGVDKDVAILEKMAFIILTKYTAEYSVAVDALEIAVNYLLNSKKQDFSRIIKNLILMIEMLFHIQRRTKLEVDTDAMKKSEELADLILKANCDVPQVEVLHFMKETWNHGVNHFFNGYITRAMWWCDYSIFLLRRSKTFRSMYEERLQKNYSILFSAKENEMLLDMSYFKIPLSCRKF